MRHGANHRVLHLGQYQQRNGSENILSIGDEVIQQVDVEPRILHSRIHTGGHLLSLAIRSLSKSATQPPASTTALFPESGGLPLPEITEIKASHYPGAAFVDFQGLIMGEHKDAIQKRCDEVVAKDLVVTCYWWEESKLRARCANVPESIDGLLEDDGSGKKTARAMEVEGLGAYPCGGTHVSRTKDVGRVVVRNIKRSKGTTKVTYEVTDG